MDARKRDKAISRYVLYGELPNLDMRELLEFYAGIAQARRALRQAEREFWVEIENEFGAEIDADS